MRLRWTIVCSIAAMMAAPRSAQATQIFSENFEAYPPNTNLVGQGGWTGAGILVSAGAGLGTNVANGRDPIGQSDNNHADHLLPSLSAANVYTLSFEAYAYSSGPRSHNTGVYFKDLVNDPGVDLLAGWFMGTNLGSLVWHFDARGITGDGSTQNEASIATYAFSPGSGFDERVFLSVTLDPVAQEVYGRMVYAGGSLSIDTPHFVMTPSQFAGVAGVAITRDFRFPEGYLGAEFDNIAVDEVAAVPEPSSVVLLLVGFATAGARAIKRRV